MIISHKHKFIFIKNRKTAGSSLEVALSKFCGSDDILPPIGDDCSNLMTKLGYGKPRNYKYHWSKYDIYDLKKILFPKKGRHTGYHTHMPAWRVKKLVGREIRDSYYKFCFERNSFDKMVSYYHWKNQFLKKKLNFEEFVKKYGYTCSDRNKYTVNNKIIVDKVYLFENMSNALEDISKKLNLNEPISLQGIKTKANIRKDKRHYQKIIKDEIKKEIEILMCKEILEFGFKF